MTDLNQSEADGTITANVTVNARQAPGTGGGWVPSQRMQPSAQDGHREQYWESEDENGDPRRPGTITANANVDAGRVPGAIFGEGGRRGVRDEDGAGSLVFVVNTDVNNSPLTPLMVDS